MVATCTWALGACAAAAGTAEPARIDPAAPSARIAGMMDRLMRMIPPWHLPRSAACHMVPSARTAHLSHVDLLSVLGYSMY